MRIASKMLCIMISSTLTICFNAIYSFGAAAPAAPAAPAQPATKPSAVAPAAAGDKKAPVAAAPAAEKVNPNLDLNLKKALDALKFRYEVNPEGTCRLVFTFGKERSHQVFVTSKKESFMGFDYRRVWATAWKSKELPSAEIMSKLLQDSATKKIGGWELHRWSDGYRLILAQKMPADASGPALEAAIRLVVNGADYMEEQLTKKDEF